MGRLWKSSNPEKNCGAGQYWTVTAYDALDRPVTVTAPDNSVTQTAYEGSRTLVADAGGRTRRLRADGLGRLVEVRENEKSWRGGAVGVSAEPTYTTSYQYNGRDLLTQVAQEGALARSFLYDTAGRLVQASQPEWGGPTLYRYDGSGNLVYKLDARNVAATLEYDWLNRITRKSYTGGAVTTPEVDWCYDGKVWSGTNCGSSGIANAKGRQSSVWSGISGTRVTGFDAAGRALGSVQKTGGVEYGFQYEYNLAGQRTKVVYPSGRGVSTSYDDAGRASSVTGMLGTTPTSYATGLGYAAHGALSQATLGNGVVVEQWQYSAARKQARRVQWGVVGSPESVGALEWHYCATGDYATECPNNAGNVVRHLVRPLGVTETFGYDSLNRLVSAGENGTPVWSQSMGYDQRGNRWVNPPQAGLWSLTTQTPQSAAAYTSQNRVAAWNYDAAGNVLTLGANTGLYDAENRLAQRTHTVTGATTAYSYDGNGRRVQAVDSSPAQTRVYVYTVDGELAAEYGGTATATETQYLGVDALGSTRVAVDGAGVKRYDYVPFGEALLAGYGGRSAAQGYESDEMGTAVKVKFTGKERDSETGLDYFGARYFYGAHGRWTSPDKPFVDQFAGDPQSWNLYSYVRNNPLRYIDDDGRGARELWLGVTNAVSSNAGGVERIRSNDSDIRLGQRIGDVVSFAGGLIEMAGGGTIAGGGAAACGTGVLCAAGAPAAIGGAAIAGHGALLTGNATINLMASAKDSPQSSGDTVSQDKPTLIDNPKHHPKSDSPQPKNAKELFDSSVTDKSGVRWAKDSDGTIHRFSAPSNGQSHWNGSTAGRKPIRRDDIPIEIRRQLP